MAGWTERITGILGRAPTGAQPYSNLLQLLKELGPDPTGREELILKQMTEQPERFRVIPGRLGPWMNRAPRGGSPNPGSRVQSRIGDPWILSNCAGAPNHGYEERVMGQIRESLQAWGKEVDTGSQGAVARWIGANREAERALGQFLTRGRENP